MIADLNQLAVQVDYKIAGGKNPCILELPPKQNCLDAFELLSQIARLGEVVIRAGVQSGNLIGFRGMHREDDNRCLNQEAQTAGDFDSIDIRQPDIEDNHIGLQRWDHLENFFTGTGFVNRIPSCGQPSTKNLAECILVIHQQNCRAPIFQRPSAEGGLS
jgi:hypothetical protein